jgi:UDP-GlcNAc:undecaprenyl-phosphate GlcNAc-1-phosphate transferase
LTLATVIAPFLVSLAIAALAAPAVGRFAASLGVVDQPSARSVNLRPGIPLMGGLAVGLAFYVGLGLAVILVDETVSLGGHIEGVVLGGLLLLVVGAFDDRWSLRPLFKLLCQIGAAAIAILHDFRIVQVTDPFSMQVLQFPEWVMWVVTTLWIVGITNALNLMDGLDGCSTGVGAIIAATLTFICWQTGLHPGIVVGVAFVGALLGFLPYNFPPGRIFLGDTGALFIGYILALLSLEGFRKATVLTFVVPLLALAVPILDTGLSILRRLRRRRHIFSPDRGHMHHRLLESAGTQQSAVISIYFLTACFCVIAVSFTRLQGYAAVLFLVAVVALTIRLLRNLGFFDLEEPSTPQPQGAGREGKES